MNTPSQTSQTVERIESISTLKVQHPTRSPTSATFKLSVKFVCLGRSSTIGDFYDECDHEHEILPVWNIGNA